MVGQESDSQEYQVLQTLALTEWQQLEVACRAILRALPISNTGVLDDLQRLHLFRAALLLCVAAKFGRQTIQTMSTRKLEVPSHGVGRNLILTTKNAVKTATLSADWDWHETIKVCLIHVTSAAESDFRKNQVAFEALGIGEQAKVTELFDTDLNNIPSSPGKLLERPLWSETDRLPSPTLCLDGKQVSFDAIETTAFLQIDFWRHWYQGFLDGHSISWDLQLQVALLDDRVWMAGPTTVAKKIAAIRARYDLSQVAIDVGNQMSSGFKIRSLPPRGHNNPPYLIDEPQLSNSVPSVRRAVKTLEEQSESPAPEKAEVELALSTIIRWRDAVLEWLGRKADLAVDTAIKWAIPAGGGYLVLNPKQLQALIDAGRAFLPFLN